MKADNLQHQIRKEEAIGTQPLKQSHLTDRKSPMKGKSEYKREYVGHEGKAPEEFRAPDTLNFGDVAFHTSTQKTAFADYRDNPQVKEGHQNTKGLQLNIKEEGRFGRIFKGKEEHAERYNKPQNGNEAVVKTGKWIKGKDQRPDLPFEGKSSQKRDYRGHSADFARRQNERFDNLAPAKESQVNNVSHYQEKHAHKQPNTVNNSTLHEINRDLDRKAELGIRAYNVPGQSTYKREHSRTPNKDATARDNLVKSTLQQMHSGFQYVEK